MSDEKFQVIVVGAGPAGSAAAYRLAKQGCEVLLMERGKTPGSKNVSGGRLYGYALEALMPGEWADAPLEREVKREVLTMMTDNSTISLDCFFSDLPPGLSYTVLRSKLDAWLARKAEEAGAMLVTGATVERLIEKDGRIVGIETGGERFDADLVICADGVNSILAQQAGLIKPVKAETIAVGVKQVIGLTEQTINDRFNVKTGQGAGLLLVGACTRGLQGGGFLYTNRESVSLGLVVDSAALKRSGENIADMADDIRQHPAIARLIEGGTLMEYAAHLIPEGGVGSVARLTADGAMLAGDAAGLVINNGFTVRGMDYAIMSGIAAADTAVQALAAGDTGRRALRGYETELRRHVLRDMETFRFTHDFMASTPDLYTTYPQVLEAMMKNIFMIDGGPGRRLPTAVKESIKGRLSLWKLVKDGMRGVKAI